jgi:hypothetical protein
MNNVTLKDADHTGWRQRARRQKKNPSQLRGREGLNGGGPSGCGRRRLFAGALLVGRLLLEPGRVGLLERLVPNDSYYADPG